MAPFYKGFDPEMTLHQDDINGIQSLYGTNFHRVVYIHRDTIQVAPDDFKKFNLYFQANEK